VQVIKGTEALNITYFSELYETGRNVCEGGDLCVGIPMSGYDDDTYPQCVLYFNDRKTTKRGIGRYLVIPRPNIPAVLAIADNFPSYTPGQFYAYSQWYSSKGVKIAAHGQSAIQARTICDRLKSLSLMPPDKLFVDAPGREVARGQNLELHLRRITTFDDNKLLKNGRNSGNEIWSKY
jgi:hypothetical protein